MAEYTVDNIDVRWDIPGGNTVGVFLDDMFHNSKFAAMVYLKEKHQMDETTAETYLQSLPQYPIQSGIIILKRLKVCLNNPKYSGKEMSVLISKSSKWFDTDIDEDTNAEPN